MFLKRLQIKLKLLSAKSDYMLIAQKKARLVQSPNVKYILLGRLVEGAAIDNELVDGILLEDGSEWVYRSNKNPEKITVVPAYLLRQLGYSGVPSEIYCSESIEIRHSGTK